jgi:hypothetical protein
VHACSSGVKLFWGEILIVALDNDFVYGVFGRERG